MIRKPKARTIALIRADYPYKGWSLVAREMREGESVVLSQRDAHALRQQLFRIGFKAGMCRVGGKSKRYLVTKVKKSPTARKRKP